MPTPLSQYIHQNTAQYPDVSDNIPVADRWCSRSSRVHLDAQAPPGFGQRLDARQQEVGVAVLAEDDLDVLALHRLDVPLARQVLQRLAHRVARDPEVAGQGVL